MLKISFAKRALLLSGVAGLLSVSAPAHAQLERALDIARSSTAQSAQSQQRVENANDQAGSMVREYRAVRQQIDNIQLFVDQQDIYLQSQAQELDSLNNQLNTVEAIKQGMSPMMLRMAIALEDFVMADLPFLRAERLARVERVKAALGDPSIDPASQYRLVLNAFEIEVGYGQRTESYEGAHPSDPGKIVNFLKFGRTALLYMTKDETEIARYNIDNGQWEPVDLGTAMEVREAIRVAKGEAAPLMLAAPVVKGQGT